MPGGEVWDHLTGDLSLPTLRRHYAAGTLTPAELVRSIYRRIAASGRDTAWITIADETASLCRAEALPRQARPGDLPLYGVPFAVKDNIDVAGLPTTAACPAFRYMPETSAPAVTSLIAAGAICIGKTNLDQFATGLCGVRSPYGAVPSLFNADYPAGGSSSGSAVVVGAGLVSFALGTDTGGSGRIPAGYNNVVGIKPTLGLVSLRGVVPNCRSLDTVSVFALTSADGADVLRVIAGFDPDDPFSRAPPPGFGRKPPMAATRFGVPAKADLAYFGDTEAAALFQAAIGRLGDIGGSVEEIDFAPFLEAGRLMFEGAWVAERAVGIGGFLSAHPEAVLPVTRGILETAQRWRATDAFAQLHRLRSLQRMIARDVWSRIDALVVPTAATAWSTAEHDHDPIERNNGNGRYSYFVNLLDLAALAVPNGFLPTNGVAMGVTFIAPAWQDGLLSALGGRYHATLGVPPGLAGQSHGRVAEPCITVPELC